MNLKKDHDEPSFESGKPAEPTEKGLIVPSTLQHRQFWERAIRYQFIYSMVGLIIGVLCIMSGLLLFIKGVTGSTDLLVQAPGLRTRALNAAPGAILFIVGIFFVALTRLSIKPKG